MADLYVSPTTQMIVRNGVSCRMQAGVARPLPASLVQVALTKGVTVFGAEAPQTAPVGELQIKDVVAAIKALMESGDKSAFSARTGEPSLTALRKQVGRSVSDAERDAAWAQVQAEV